MHATLAFDEGPGAGLGHRRRMEAVAAELNRRGHECVLVPLSDRELPPSDAGVEVLVVDSYRVRADDRRFAGARVVGAVDDLARNLAVDLVVDPSPGAIGSAHRSARRVLAGATYALVPPLDARCRGGSARRGGPEHSRDDGSGRLVRDRRGRRGLARGEPSRSGDQAGDRTVGRGSSFRPARSRCTRPTGSRPRSRRPASL